MFELMPLITAFTSQAGSGGAFVFNFSNSQYSSSLGAPCGFVQHSRVRSLSHVFQAETQCGFVWSQTESWPNLSRHAFEASPCQRSLLTVTPAPVVPQWFFGGLVQQSAALSLSPWQLS